MCAGSLREQLGEILPVLEALSHSAPSASISTSGDGLRDDSAQLHPLQTYHTGSQASSIACCREYSNLSTAMQGAGYSSFPCSSVTSGAADDVSQSRGSEPSTAAGVSSQRHSSFGKSDPSTGAPASRAACLAGARAPLLRLVAQGACHIRLRLPLLAACIPLLEAEPPALRHAELHALLAALEVGTERLLQLTAAVNCSTSLQGSTSNSTQSHTSKFTCNSTVSAVSTAFSLILNC